MAANGSEGSSKKKGEGAGIQHNALIIAERKGEPLAGFGLRGARQG
jgi:hypothetical protein